MKPLPQLWARHPVLLATIGLLVAGGVITGALALSRPAPSAGTPLSPTELKYRLVETFGQPVYCDRDSYPVGRPELPAALAAFPAISQDTEVFATILRKHHLEPGTSLSDEQKLTIYRDYKMLQAVALATEGSKHRFTITVGAAGKYQGSRVDGTIDDRGAIEGTRTTQAFINCPICLSGGTRIDTPDGPTRVEDLRPGMVVWTADRNGARRSAVILETSRTAVPAGHQMVALALDDGRLLQASPGHPTADGRTLGSLVVGERLDGARIVSVERIAYAQEATYDLLPFGDTGWYWADGILVGSTLR
jgi:hypothetical protein